VDGDQFDSDRAFEDPADGCPGGDQRCWFVQSLLALYYRRRDQQGNRVGSPRLDRCTDPLILDAIAFFESEEQACTAFTHEAYMRKLDEERSRGT
jgi:hypothetical protein